MSPAGRNLHSQDVCNRMKTKNQQKPAGSRKKAAMTSKKAASGTESRRVAPSAGDQKGVSKKAVPPPGVIRRKPTAEEIAHQQALERFEHALQIFNQNQFAKARGLFEKLLETTAPELAERARVYLRICDQRLSRPSLQLKTAEDYYNYAVGLANEGNAEESEQYLLKALKLAPKADYLYYALATTYALRDDVEGALKYLAQAIELNERNRYQAQNDPDFAGLLEDPRFTELLYPEKPMS